MNLPSFSSSPSEQEPGVGPEMPATLRADEIVGRWGPCVVSESQRPCAHRSRGAVSVQTALRDRRRFFRGVIMHLADQATPQELRLKGSPGGKNYIGPPGPAGGEQDREIISFDGRVLVTRFIDKDAATRYGNMVYVRCGARA